jgi:hypothetical protein
VIAPVFLPSTPKNPIVIDDWLIKIEIKDQNVNIDAKTYMPDKVLDFRINFAFLIKKNRTPKPVAPNTSNFGAFTGSVVFHDKTTKEVRLPPKARSHEIFFSKSLTFTVKS